MMAIFGPKRSERAQNRTRRNPKVRPHRSPLAYPCHQERRSNAANPPDEEFSSARARCFQTMGSFLELALTFPLRSPAPTNETGFWEDVAEWFDSVVEMANSDEEELLEGRDEYHGKL